MRTALLWTGVFVLFLGVNTPAQISLTGTNYSQNFDGMGSAGTFTPSGWFVGALGANATNVVVASTNVAVSSGSATTGTNYNYGVAGVNPVTDRALGSLAFNSPGNLAMEVRFTNNTGNTITNIAITYDGEQWRDGGAAGVGPTNRLDMFFSTNGSNFTAMSSQFGFNGPKHSSSAAALDGNNAANRVAGITGNYYTNLANGATFYLRWFDVNDAGNDDGLAIDNVNINFDVLVPAATNSWISATSGKWETPAAWSLGSAPNISNNRVLVTNPASKTVTVDGTTSGSFPSSMYITNLVLYGVGGATNTLALINAGTNVPFRIAHGAQIGPDARLIVTNSIFRVDAVNFENLDLYNDTIFADGAVLDAFNAFVILHNGVTLRASNSTVRAGLLQLANNAVFPDYSATFIAKGGTNEFGYGLYVANGSFCTGLVSMVDTRVISTNGDILLGTLNAFASMTMSNCIMDVRDLIIGDNSSIAELNITGGTNTISRFLDVGLAGTGTLWLNNSLLVNTNNIISVSGQNPGTLIASNSTIIGTDFRVGQLSGSQGTFTMVGGQLLVTNSAFSQTTIGVAGSGNMRMQGGNALTEYLLVGSSDFSYGNLTLAAGATVQLNAGLFIGQSSFANGEVWIENGTLGGTNALIDLDSTGAAKLTLSNGTVFAKDMLIGDSSGSGGELTMEGGALNSYATFSLGNSQCNAFGVVNMSGGTLAVTNSFSDAKLEVYNGTFNMTGGLLKVDRLIVTNGCANFFMTGGTVIYNEALLQPNFDFDGDGIPNASDLRPLDPTDAAADPDGDGFTNLQEYQAGTSPTNSTSALRILSIAPNSGTNLLVRWTTVPGRSNALQAVTSAGFTTNFTDLITINGATGTVTNYLDQGALLTPARFYRVRVVP